MNKKTKVHITSSENEIICDDFHDNFCLECIAANCQKNEFSLIQCPKNQSVKKRLFYRKGSIGNTLICDENEKTQANFRFMANLVFHNLASMISIKKTIAEQSISNIDSQITQFKHNIERINGEAIREFESWVSSSNSKKNYKSILKFVEGEIARRPDFVASFIARQALNNQRMQTEMFLSKMIGDRYEPNLTKTNPWDAIIPNVYLLYPSARENKIEIRLDEYYNKFLLDYNVLKIASYYVIENSIKYSFENSTVHIAFKDDGDKLYISFQMKSVMIKKSEIDSIFDYGFQGENAKKLGKSGHGFGLFHAKKLLLDSNANIYVNAGETEKSLSNGVPYSDNIFFIELKKN